VRNSLNEGACTYLVEDVSGEGQAEFLHNVKAMIQTNLSPVGATGFIGAPRVPQLIAPAITAIAQAIQQAARARSELATKQAEAAKKLPKPKATLSLW
jgi:hypothetical protein